MIPGTSSFLIPREPFLSRRTLKARATESLQVGQSLGARHFFFWARNALFHSLQALQVPRTARALLPAYLCKAAVEPFEAYGMRVDFYRVGRDCKADFRDLANKVQPDTRVVLTAHYFGFPQDIIALGDFCSQRQLLLFEDCAHVLQGSVAGQPLGSFGHASVFSYRKFLPMFDGAELFLRESSRTFSIPPRQPSRFGSAAARHIIGQSLDSSSGFVAAFLRHAVELAKKFLPAKGQTTADRSSPQPAVDNNSASFDPGVLDQPITSSSRWVLRHSDVAAIVALRRQNFSYLHQHLNNSPGLTPLFKSLADGVCPWVYPLFLDGVPNAHLLIRAKGIPAVTWCDVRPSSLSRGEFADADFLYDNLVFLPIHQNMTADQLSLVADVVKKVRAEFPRLAPERIPVAS